MGIYCFRCLYNLINWCIRLSVCYILTYCTCKNPCLLKNHAESTAEAVSCNITDASARNCNFSALNIIKTQKQIYYSSLSATRRACYCNLLTALYIKTEIFYKRYFRNIWKFNIFKAKASVALLKNFLSGIVRNFLFIKDCKYSLCWWYSILKLCNYSRNFVERLCILICICKKARKLSDWNNAYKSDWTQCTQSTCNSDCCIYKTVYKSCSRIRKGGIKSCLSSDFSELTVDFIESFLRTFFIYKSFYKLLISCHFFRKAYHFAP